MANKSQGFQIHGCFWPNVIWCTWPKTVLLKQSAVIVYTAGHGETNSSKAALLEKWVEHKCWLNWLFLSYSTCHWANYCSTAYACTFGHFSSTRSIVQIAEIQVTAKMSITITTFSSYKLKMVILFLHTTGSHEPSHGWSNVTGLKPSLPPHQAWINWDSCNGKWIRQKTWGMGCRHCVKDYSLSWLGNPAQMVLRHNSCPAPGRNNIQKDGRSVWRCGLCLDGAVT